MVNKDEYIIT